jgi:hypothetical protein
MTPTSAPLSPPSAIIEQDRPIEEYRQTPHPLIERHSVQATMRDTIGVITSRRILETHLGLAFPRARLRLCGETEIFDFAGYNDCNKLAFEYHNALHYQADPQMYLGIAKLAAIQARDAKKAAMCQRAGILLLAVPHDADLGRYLRDQFVAIARRQVDPAKSVR